MIRIPSITGALGRDQLKVLQELAGITNGKGLLHFVTLDRLECKETEDSGWDETYMVITIDNLAGRQASQILGTIQGLLNVVDSIPAVELPLKADGRVWGWFKSGDAQMNEPGSADVDITVPLLPGLPLSIQVYDEDGDFYGDDADLLGAQSITIPQDGEPFDGTLHFTEDDANYVLHYRRHALNLDLGIADAASELTGGLVDLQNIPVVGSIPNVVPVPLPGFGGGSNEAILHQPLESVADAWLPDGTAHSLTGLAACGDRLFASDSNNKLWTRPLETGSVWEQCGHANDVVSLGAPPDGSSLLALTSDGSLWRRPAVLDDVPWERTATVAEGAAIGVTAAGIFAATTKNDLEFVPTGSDQAIRVGHANDVVSMAGGPNDTLLCLTRDGSIWTRPAVQHDEPWTVLAPAPAGASHLTVVGDELVVVNADHELFRRRRS